MTQMLLVSAFPDSMAPQHRLSGEPDSEASHPDVAPAMVPPVKRAKQFTLLGIPSSSSSTPTAATTADNVEDSTPEVPCSPLVFRSFQDGGYARPTTPDHSLTSRSDRTVISTSKHLKLESGHVAGSSRAPLSTKDSIAVLGLSRSPSPDYRILQGSLASSSSQQLDAKNIPPRSSSLTSLPMVTPSPSRPHSPGPSVVVDKDDCSAIVFADPSVIDSDILQPRKRSLPALLPSPIPSRSPSPSTKSDISHPSPANTLLRRKGSALALLSHKSDNKSSKPTLQVTLDSLPSALMGGGAPMLNVTPVLLEGQWQVKAKTKPAANALPTATTPSKSSTLGRSFKFLRARRALSISSVECLTQGSRTVDDGSKRVEDPAASTVTLVDRSDEQTKPGGGPSRGAPEDGKKSTSQEEIVKTERRTKNETVVKITTQQMVGGAWKEQDYEEVIPILREMKFVGK
ncbi:hypothetical protein EIP86_005219 [Pleurotus ostreatoroseus]|nr:hypothetical protein EIP86_005219 [Pleurotus ostreatoroseus]